MLYIVLLMLMIFPRFTLRFLTLFLGGLFRSMGKH